MENFWGGMLFCFSQGPYQTYTQEFSEWFYMLPLEVNIINSNKKQGLKSCHVVHKESAWSVGGRQGCAQSLWQDPTVKHKEDP